eukprot:CAMPEP_0201282386 /NCGR_PEP_ID=MMETSP1317-20130820/5514_1 /ASSEMBLY_ACC=CAM_ASM_000770 /TAXON_ID=187299 /ORGANISM="Undescribed Undescribed, Strain Undescribed" /LENGTH=149 /DNA_ID=CAMNT_0047594893 /DNA_START=1170 /DNA_END=1619 /DNA_ORIENTATION=-
MYFLTRLANPTYDDTEDILVDANIELPVPDTLFTSIRNDWTVTMWFKDITYVLEGRRLETDVSQYYSVFLDLGEYLFLNWDMAASRDEDSGGDYKIVYYEDMALLPTEEKRNYYDIPGLERNRWTHLAMTFEETDQGGATIETYLDAEI